MKVIDIKPEVTSDIQWVKVEVEGVEVNEKKKQGWIDGTRLVDAWAHAPTVFESRGSARAQSPRHIEFLQCEGVHRQGDRASTNYNGGSFAPAGRQRPPQSRGWIPPPPMRPPPLYEERPREQPEPINIHLLAFGVNNCETSLVDKCCSSKSGGR